MPSSRVSLQLLCDQQQGLLLAMLYGGQHTLEQKQMGEARLQEALAAKGQVLAAGFQSTPSAA